MNGFFTLSIMSSHVAGDDPGGDAQRSQATAQRAGEVPTLSELNAPLRFQELTEDLFRVQPGTWRLSIAEILVPIACAGD